MLHLPRTPLLCMALALSSCGGGSTSGEVVARAAGHAWSAEAAADLVAPRTDLPATPEVIRTLANLWVDYTLLATAVAADSTLSQLDFSSLVGDLAEDRLIMALRDSVLKVEAIAPAEMQARYQREAPGSIILARQILLAWPRGATEAQRDSLHQAMVALRAQIVEGGEDFANLAMSHSQDAASASQGGNIGPVIRGQLVLPLEDVLFSLAPGEVSPPIASPYGLHLLKVEARQTPSLEDFRALVSRQQALHAESVYIADLVAGAQLRLAADAPGIVRSFAQEPRVALGRLAEIRPLLSYRGGEVTQGEALRHLQKQDPQLRNQIAQAQDDSIPARLLNSIAHRELLLAEATRRGFVIRPEVLEGLEEAARANLVGAARQLGLFPDQATSQQAREDQVPELVTTLLSNMLSGQRREVTPLGAMTYLLMARYPWEVSPVGLDSAVVQIVARRQGLERAQ